MSSNDCAPIKASAVTILDSPNIMITNNDNTNIYSGSAVGQGDINYLLAAKYAFTGSLIEVNNTVGFGYGILVAPTGSIVYPQTSDLDFQFYLNGVLIDRDRITAFTEGGIANNESTASFDLGFDIRSYDVVTAIGKFKV